MESLHVQIAEKFKDQVIKTHANHGDETVVLVREALLEVTRFIKEDPAWNMDILMDLTAVDGLEMNWTPRYQVVYHFYSSEHNHRLRIKVPVDKKDAVVPTLTDFWAAANWFEREAWDMFGIHFEGHPDLRRLLMYPEFEGHPLRKYYPFNKRQPLIGPKN